MKLSGAAVAGAPRKPTAKRPTTWSRYQARVYAAPVVRNWLERETVRFPGLTNAEVALVERLIADLESA